MWLAQREIIYRERANMIVFIYSTIQNTSYNQVRNLPDNLVLKSYYTHFDPEYVRS